MQMRGTEAIPQIATNHYSLCLMVLSTSLKSVSCMSDILKIDVVPSRTRTNDESYGVNLKILLIDDHQLFLDGLTAILVSTTEVQAVDSANDGKTALTMLQTGDYDVALIDLRLPVADGFNILQNMHTIGSLTPVIVVTASQDPQDIRRAKQCGAMGYIAKSSSSHEILTAIHAVLAGELVFPDHTLSGIRGTQTSPSQQHWARQHNLTPRQVEVLRLVKQGLPNQEIAQQLFLSLATVKSHISTLFKVLDAKNRAEAIRKAQQFGLD